ncbi:hypothetical protein M5689_016438 [Euphorbia peplus]|nr:hypothetical protein M5689_016438 [Euphorbia peplus]
MGKKRPQKTKELSVAIAEASSAAGGDETHQQTPRKRGRPRKIIIQEIQENKQEIQEQEQEKATEIQSRNKEEDEVENKKDLEEALPAPAPRRSSRRRKSKPRKSS